MSGSGLPYTEDTNVFLVVASFQPREATTGNTSLSAGYRVATLKKKDFSLTLHFKILFSFLAGYRYSLLFSTAYGDG